MLKKYLIIAILLLSSICYADKKVTYLAYEYNKYQPGINKIVKVIYCYDVGLDDGFLKIYNKTLAGYKCTMIIKSEYIIVEDAPSKQTK